ncbi:cyclic peptide transporter [Candidatus Magnetomorum sp. HK-1]|nr:cyclic peptide transporter [Candidatus Magnetomorum sp. HK-1]
MDLFEFYRKEVEVISITPLITIIASAISQGLILTVIINATVCITPESSNLQFLILYILLFMIFIYGKYYCQQKVAEEITQIIRNVRLRIADKIRKSEYLVIESMGNEKIYAQLTHDTGNISEFTVWMLNQSQASILVFVCAIYIFFESIIAFVLISVLLTSMLFIYFAFFHKNYDKILSKSLKQEISIMEMFNQLFFGFKELKINQKMSDDHFDDYSQLLEDNRELKTESGYRFITQYTFAQASYFSFFGVILFALPVFTHAPVIVVKKIVATGMFIMGPFNMFLACVPIYAKTKQAITNIYTLEKELDASLKSGPMMTRDSEIDFTQFECIEFEKLTFKHYDSYGDVAFKTGPINLNIKKGELVFITGGNGSGKTTLMKLLCGLYSPDSGCIKIDDILLKENEYARYRDLYAMILSDYYLFDKLYGIDDPDESRIEYLLQKMQLSHKTSIINRSFTNIDLSTGQKKRLAMIFALLQDSQIYIFDEWAADQDVEFREFFYETLLKEITSKGKSVIAVSHDDRYYHVADRVLKMEYGRFVES